MKVCKDQVKIGHVDIPEKNMKGLIYVLRKDECGYKKGDVIAQPFQRRGAKA